MKKRWSHGLQVQSSYTLSTSEDTTQNSTFFSDSTTATTSAMPEFIEGYNKGLSDFHAKHNWVTNFVWEPFSGWRVSGIARFRSGSPLTPFVQTNRSRSLWSPSLGPGTGPIDQVTRRGGMRRTRSPATRPVVRPVGVRASADRHLRQRWAQ